MRLNNFIEVKFSNVNIYDRSARMMFLGNVRTHRERSLAYVVFM